MADREKVIRDLTWLADLDSYPALIAKDAIELLKEQEAEISFLKMMQLQIMHNMNDEDIGNAVAQVIGLKGR